MELETEEGSVTSTGTETDKELKQGGTKRFFFFQDHFDDLVARRDAVQTELNGLKKESGDISRQSADALFENSLFDEQAHRIIDLSGKVTGYNTTILGATIIPYPKTADTVKMGTVVALSEGTSKKKEYYQIGSYIIPMDKYNFKNQSREKPALVSNQSPIAKSLLGKKKGEVAIIELPKGSRLVKIHDIFLPSDTNATSHVGTPPLAVAATEA